MPQASSQSSAEIHRRLFHFDSIIRERQDEMKGKKTCHMNGIYSRVPSRETEKIWGATRRLSSSKVSIDPSTSPPRGLKRHRHPSLSQSGWSTVFLPKGNPFDSQVGDVFKLLYLR